MKPLSLLGADMVREQPEVSVRRDEGQNSLGLPAFEANARVKTHVVQQPRILKERKRDRQRERGINRKRDTE